MKILLQFLKITTIALLFSLAIHFAVASIWDDGTQTRPSWMSEVQNFANTGNNNKYKFKKSNTKILANIWVALSTNVGTRYKSRQQSSLYKDIPNIAKKISYQEYSDNTSLSNNMAAIQEYYNILQTDIKPMLDESYNRRETLEIYIEQLKYRYTQSIKSLDILSEKRKEYLQNMNIAGKKINNIKIKITKDFRNADARATNKNIEDYLSLKQEYTYARTHLIFINQYIKQYNYLNNYNKKVLDTLINNKDIISKNSFVVIPSTGTETLKRMNLIFSEQEYKNR